LEKTVDCEQKRVAISGLLAQPRPPLIWVRLKGNLMQPAPFFAFARTRHKIYLARAAGKAPPWTDDAILQRYRFTNVFRELDATTIWFAENLRNPLRNSIEVLPATVVFRWFNRRATGEAVKQNKNYLHPAALRKAIAKLPPPYVTSAFMVYTTSLHDRLVAAGLEPTKVNGVLMAIEIWYDTHRDWRKFKCDSLQEAHSWVKSECLGDFMAYEVISDLRHTKLLSSADDIMTWANFGPGSTRGIERLAGVGADKLDVARELLKLSQNKKYWPKEWPKLEMREIEHTLCEYYKYTKAVNGEGRPKENFRGGK
jgi:hypothetical protein